MNLDKIVSRRDEVLTKVFIFQSTVYTFVQVLFIALHFEHEHYSGVFISFIIISANYLSQSIVVKNISSFCLHMLCHENQVVVI